MSLAFKKGGREGGDAKANLGFTLGGRTKLPLQTAKAFFFLEDLDNCGLIKSKFKLRFKFE